MSLKLLHFFNHKDLVALVGHAKDHLLKLPRGVRLKGMQRAMTEAEKLAVSYLAAVLIVLGSLGVDTVHLVLEYETPDSETLE